jgi:predicted dehydrogenase
MAAPGAESGSSTNRRGFLQASGAVALTAASYRQVRGANERVGIGFIGFGLIGKRHVLDFRDQPDAACVAIADVHRGRLDEGSALIGGSVRAHGDFRRVLDDPDVDAAIISTPDHWHGLMTLMACAAGKDVYVEKPTTLFVREGRRMVEVARRHGRIVQVGTQQRSGPHYQKARGLIREGGIGKVVSVRMAVSRNVMPGFGRPPDGPAPPELDYDLWLGPAPLRPYNPNRSLYHFRWFWDYSGGQMTNLGQHSLDIVQWVMGVEAPRSVFSTGGRFAMEDNGETPDTQDALFTYDGWTASWSHREASRGLTPASHLEFCGTRGSLAITRKGFVVTADPKVAPENAVPQFGGAHPVGGPTRTGPVAKGERWTEPAEDRSGDEYDQFRRHARNFLDCVRSREQPASDIESGHRVATVCHLANLSLRLGRSLSWNAQQERTRGDAEADELLDRPYRRPWDAELRALLGGG